MTTEETTATTQVYRVHIKAPAQAIWDAITRPEWNERYGYRFRSEYDLRPGGAHRSLTTDDIRKEGAARGFTAPDVGVDGEVIEADPPRKLVVTWRMVMDPDTAAEGFTRVSYELSDGQPGVTRLTVVHDLTGAPRVAALVAGAHEGEGAGGGWAWVLSDLKTLLETGAALAG